MQDDHQGNSTAAWVGVGIMLVGTAVACWGVFFGPSLLLYVGLGLGVVGALAWVLLDRAGYGVERPLGSVDADDERPASRAR